MTNKLKKGHHLLKMDEPIYILDYESRGVLFLIRSKHCNNARLNALLALSVW